MSTCANDNHHPDQTAEGQPLLDQLPFPAQFFIWGMRSWVMALKSRQSFADISGDGFAQFGLGAAGQSLDEVFQVIAVSASRPIDIRCIKCRQVSEDEVLLLETAAAAQAGHLHLAYAGLAELLPAAAVRNAFPSLISLAKLFAHAGLMLSLDRPLDQSGDHARPTGTQASDRTARAVGQKGGQQISGQAAQQASRRASLLQQAAARLPRHEMPALVH